MQLKEVQIGNQVWMQENLAVDNYLNGEPISTDWEAVNQSVETRSVVKKTSESNYLYTWYAIEDTRGLIPDGWRIPTKGDWEELFQYLGGKELAAIKLKNVYGWELPNEATNESGFSAMPTGIMNESLSKTTTYAYYWTSTEFSTNAAYFVELKHNTSYCVVNAYNKQLGLSIRLIKE